ncbi:MAG TPA: hypothetical protein VF992_09100 [Thermoplasmata archaeon]
MRELILDRRKSEPGVSSVSCTDDCPEFLTRLRHRIVICGEEELYKTPFEPIAGGNALADVASDGQSENAEETEGDSKGFHYDQTGKNGDEPPNPQGGKRASQPENQQQRTVTPNLNPQRGHRLAPFRNCRGNSPEAGHLETFIVEYRLIPVARDQVDDSNHEEVGGKMNSRSLLLAAPSPFRETTVSEMAPRITQRPGR